MHCIIHDTDLDGYTAALCLLEENTITIGSRRNYLEELNKHDIKRLDIVDLPIPEDVAEELNKKYELRIIDHHKTSEYLRDKPYGIWNDKYSAAGLAFMISDKKHLITLVNYVQDRDLWKFKLPFSKEMNKYISTEFDYTFETLENIGITVRHNMAESAKIGSLYLKEQQKLIDTIINGWKSLYFQSIPCINIPHILISDALDQFRHYTKSDLVCAVHSIDKNNVILSFRGNGAYEIATRLGGGGHPLAAGAKISMEYFLGQLS